MPDVIFASVMLEVYCAVYELKKLT